MKSINYVVLKISFKDTLIFVIKIKNLDLHQKEILLKKRLHLFITSYWDTQLMDFKCKEVFSLCLGSKVF